MSITTVMFDFDGTLVNTNNLIIKCFQHTYRTYTGEEADPAELMRYFGEPLGVSMAWRFGEKYRKEAVEDVYKRQHLLHARGSDRRIC